MPHFLMVFVACTPLPLITALLTLNQWFSTWGPRMILRGPQKLTSPLGSPSLFTPHCTALHLILGRKFDVCGRFAFFSLHLILGGKLDVDTLKSCLFAVIFVGFATTNCLT